MIRLRSTDFNYALFTMPGPRQQQLYQLRHFLRNAYPATYLTAYIHTAMPRLLIHGHQHRDAETPCTGTKVLGVYGHRLIDAGPSMPTLAFAPLWASRQVANIHVPAGFSCLA